MMADFPKKYRPVLRAAAAEFGVDAEDLLSPMRGSPAAAKARQLLMHVIYSKDPGSSHTSVGKMVGRVRKTVAHGVAASIHRVETSPVSRAQYLRVCTHFLN